MQLRQRCNPRGGLVVAALRGFMKAEGLECAGDRKEKQRGSGKNADVKMYFPQELQCRMALRHSTSESENGV